MIYVNIQKELLDRRQYAQSRYLECYQFLFYIEKVRMYKYHFIQDICTNQTKRTTINR